MAVLHTLKIAIFSIEIKCILFSFEQTLNNVIVSLRSDLR